MTSANAFMRRTIGVLVGLATLVQAQDSFAVSLDAKQIAELRSERKKAARQGKLPLPGTPNLKQLDERLARRGLPSDAAMLIRIFKAESELEVWMSRGRGAHYALFATYPICYWSGTLGPKLKEGDRQAPEGFYTVTLPQAHPNGPRWPKSLDIGFPNSFDRLHVRTGSDILIHGGCASIGCFAMTNAVHKEVYRLAVRALDAGQSYVHVHSFPFRMTDENLARFERATWNHFWRNLKRGYDLFEQTQRPPRISVCKGRYGFAKTGDLEGDNPGPIALCPRTETLLEELTAIQSTVAKQDGPLQPAATANLALANGYLEQPPWSRGDDILVTQGPNSRLELTPLSLPKGVSPILTRPLPCSLALPSCRKYAALRASLLQKATLRSEKPVKKKKRRKKRRYSKKRKRRY